MTDFAMTIEAALVERGFEEIGGGDDFSWFRLGDRSVFIYDKHFEVYECDEPGDDQAPDYVGYSPADLGRVDAKVVLCGHWFRPMTAADRVGLAGASETCLICDWASGGAILLYEVGLRMITEVKLDSAEQTWILRD